MGGIGGEVGEGRDGQGVRAGRKIKSRNRTLLNHKTGFDVDQSMNSGLGGCAKTPRSTVSTAATSHTVTPATFETASGWENGVR